MTIPYSVSTFGVPVVAFVVGMTITAADISSFIKEIVPLVTALGVIYGIFVASRAARTVKETSATVIEQQKKIGETTESTLHEVNSAATRAQGIIEAQAKVIGMMQETAAKNEAIAAKLAQSVELAKAYAAIPHQVQAPAPSPPATEATLQSIDTNTKKTTDDVQELKDKS